MLNCQGNQIHHIYAHVLLIISLGVLVLEDIIAPKDPKMLKFVTGVHIVIRRNFLHQLVNV